MDNEDILDSLSSPLIQDLTSPPLAPQQREDLPEQRELSAPSSAPTPAASPQPLRRSTRTRKPIQHYKFDRNHGYHLVRKFVHMLVGVCSTLNCDSYCFKTHYAYSLAFDPSIGMVPSSTSLGPDFFLKNPNMLKAVKKDKDSPEIVKGLTGPYKTKFLEAMKGEI